MFRSGRLSDVIRPSEHPVDPRSDITLTTVATLVTPKGDPFASEGHALANDHVPQLLRPCREGTSDSPGIVFEHRKVAGIHTERVSFR